MSAQMITMSRPFYRDWLENSRSLMAWMIFASSFIVIFEPAPCDIFAILSLTFFFLPGVSMMPTIIPLFTLYLLFMLAYMTSFYANGPDKDGTYFLFSSGYTLLASLYLACFISQDTKKRFELIKSGWFVGAVLATVIALAAYVDTKGFGTALFKMGASGLIFYGRATGAFKDPNVFSTYLVFPTVMVFQSLLLGEAKRPIANFFALCLMFLALFLAFSRGAWTNVFMGASLVILLTVMTTPSKTMRARIFFYAFTAIALFSVILMVMLSIPEIQAIFVDRFALIKKYDGGERGRFGNQLNAIPMLLERPLGFGPYRFDQFFNLAPHNAFLNAFSAGGWLGGMVYFTLVGSNVFVGLKSVFTRSPFQNYAILVFSCLFGVTFQGIQIDTEHWRHYYWMIGMNWGLFAATVAYEAQVRARARNPFSQPLMA